MKEDILTLNALARDGIRTAAIARKLKRTPTATRQKASALGIPPLDNMVGFFAGSFLGRPLLHELCSGRGCDIQA